MKRCISWSLLSATLALGCGDKPPPGSVFVFNRPEHLELVCMNRGGSEDPFAGDAGLVLPLRCCSNRTTTPLAPEAFFASEKEREQLCGKSDQGSLHALVTQSARGEVAAVDLDNGKIVDSNRRIPGYTFVDVGGLPTAIVTPRELKSVDGDTLGAPWTFVASGEDNNVRAVATCSFVISEGGDDGVHCGPERLPPPKKGEEDEHELNEIAGYSEQRRRDVLEVPLPSAPADMVYVDGALWVTLPDVSAIARIDLAPLDKDGNRHPFVEEDGRAAPAQFFKIENVPDVDPGEPTVEGDGYRAVCGLGYESAFTPLTLPATPAAMSSATSAPKRLRFDELSGLLLVGDRGQPIVHALAIEDGQPFARGVLKTGAPVRDFAVTPAVPVTAPTYKQLTPKKPAPTFTLDADNELQRSENVPEFSADTRRYLYALDDRDGSLLAMTFEVDATTGAASGALLEAPQRFVAGARDRINIAGNATALEVIDTRTRTGNHVCNVADAEGLDAAINKLERALDDADDKDKDAWRDTLRTLEEAKDLASNADPLHLNGVFVAVADSRGMLAIVDVHDADMFCRAGKWCTGDGASEVERSDATGPNPLGAQRHAVRRTTINPVSVSASNDNALDEVQCPEGMFAALKDSGDDGPTLVCTSADPWTSFAAEFVVEYEGLFSATYGTWLERDDEGRLVLRAGPGLDFCAEGIVADVLDGADEGYRGDWVLPSSPPHPELENCGSPASGREPRMRVLEAYNDRLILDEPVIPSSTAGGETTPYGADNLLECYPTLMPVWLRTNDSYFVYWENALLHRMVASETDGACIEDETKDERLRSRAQPGELFQNPYIAFQLNELDDDDSPTVLNTSIDVSGGASGLASPVYLGAGADSLPVVVRYLDVTGELFVVDTTSQGLRRFGLRPFAGKSIYR